MKTVIFETDSNITYILKALAKIPNIGAMSITETEVRAEDEPFEIGK